MNEFITNGQDIKNRIIQEIRNASESIYVAMMLFTDRDIAQAIINAKKRGVLVEIIFSSHEKNRKVRKMFQKAKIPVFSFQSEDYRGKMKHRFCLIDGNTSLSGSYNYTALASKNSIEDLQITDDKNTYYHYLQEFTRLKNLIDQNINLNDIEEIQAPPSPVETFTKLVQGLVFASAEIDLQKYNDRGYECAKESKGNIDVYWTEYHNIREDIKSLATDNRLGSTKNTLINNLNNAFQIKKNELKEEKDKQQRYVEQKFARKKDQINVRI